MKLFSLPLKYKTPDAWADAALSDPQKLLSDHAYLERKAASNALEMLNRWPEPGYPKRWVSTLSRIARDEAAHLDLVARILVKHGWKLERLHRSQYAADLRGLVRRGQGPDEILDRLLISALIEARSCERFEILSRCVREAELSRLYKMLWSSEHGHFKVFLELASLVRPAAEVKRRWSVLLEDEARIIQAQPMGPGLHTSLG
jgi:tRNA-(ms[2]io[6]A)-hydroxylase